MQKNQIVEAMRPRIESGGYGVIPQQLLKAYDELDAEEKSDWRKLFDECDEKRRAGLEREEKFIREIAALENELASAQAGLLEAQAQVAADDEIIRALRQIAKDGAARAEELKAQIAALEDMALRMDL